MIDRVKLFYFQNNNGISSLHMNEISETFNTFAKYIVYRKYF